jgi:hypothetical protein
MKYQLTNTDRLSIQKAWDDAYVKAINETKLNEDAAQKEGDVAAEAKKKEIIAAHTDDEPTAIPTNPNQISSFLTFVIALAALVIAIWGLFTPEQPITKEILAQMVQTDSAWKAEYADQIAEVRTTVDAATESLKNRPTYDEINKTLKPIIKAAKKAESNSIKALKLSQKSNDRIDTLQLQVDDLQEQISNLEDFKLKLLNSGFVNMEEFKKLQAKQDLLEKQLKDRSKNTECKKHELKGMLKGTFQGEINVENDEEDRD